MFRHAIHAHRVGLGALLWAVCSGCSSDPVPTSGAPSASALAKAASEASATPTPDAGSSAAASPTTSASAQATQPDQNDASQHPVLRAVAASYGSFYRADGTWWAPFDCRSPAPDTSRMSQAEPGSVHGRKLYTLQIADFATYARETGATAAQKKGQGSPIVPKIEGASQVIVKVSYAPTEDPAQSRALFVQPATMDGKTYYPGEQKDLFVMYRPTGSAITDDGWLYGTVSPDGKQVTSAGLVASCMGCHAKAPHGRLFGIRK